MTAERRLLLVIVLAGAALAAWLGLTVALVILTLEPADRALAQQLLAPRWALALMSWVFAAMAVAGLVRRYLMPAVLLPARLAEQARALVSTEGAPPVAASGPKEIRDLAQAINALTSQRDELRRDVAERVQEASRGIQQERNRLAALMSELTQSVVVCNLDGRIVLYNNRARLQFRALSQSPTLADGAEMIGIGRSIYGVFDRQLVAHALESIHLRMARGAGSPSAQFVTTTRSGQLLRAQMAPVRAGEAAAGEPVLSGFVLMLDNVTRSFQEEHQRDQLMHGLTERSRSSLANMQTAVDMLALPDLEPDMRERFLGIVSEEVSAMSRRIADLAHTTTQGLKTRWPLEEMLGSDLLLAAQRRIEAVTGRSAPAAEVDASVWLHVDSYSLIQALTYLSARLVEEIEVRFLRLRLQSVDGRARLDLVWEGHAMSTETVMSWENDPMRFGAESTPLSVRDVVDRHGGEMWFERERLRHEAFFRFLLPLANASEQLEAAQILGSESRPEYYDFDLFQGAETDSDLDDRPLSLLSFTVFDTETTGLNPSQGDEIIQIGAIRVVNGRLLRQEAFEQLVDPGRDIPAASIPIHGITPDMVQGKPPIGEVLPAFHAFAQDTVLVAHNAAFDMKFLQLK
ncbi:MAG TPA: exonuclease domain-containing protein, partial [Burkholderiaceae bacterium]|nr:exonuclease domain-containing protein [Burkholderiaceae bacterium]